ncbi:NAD(P)-dependent oxidoreductase [bacterium]|nr:NAD(P)-dependent oxidoreductase [bacterium]
MNTKQLAMIQEDCARICVNPERFSVLKNESILITGGTGFMGSWLAESIAYLNDNHRFGIKLTLVARNMDRFRENQPHLASRNDIFLLEKNVRDLIDIPEDVSWIIHAAGTPDNRVHSSDPLDVINTIANGTMQVLDASTRLSNLKKIVNISSGWIYGSQPKEMSHVPEWHIGGPNSTLTTSAYAEAKRMGETICSVYKGQFRIPMVTLRPFAFIGPYQMIDKPWAINNFINDAINGGPIKILGNENTIRSYLYPSDMANWILTALCEGESGLVLNLGSSEGCSLREVADLICHCIPGETVVISQTLNRKPKYSIFVPDVTKAREELGLELSVSLHDAIQRTIEWLKLRQ